MGRGLDAMEAGQLGYGVSGSLVDEGDVAGPVVGPAFSSLANLVTIA